VYESVLPVKLQAPKLSVGAFQIEDSFGGDGDGRLESGETARVTVKNLNLGNSRSPNVLGTLISDSPWLTVSNTVALGPLDALTGTADAVFTVTISNDAPQAFPVHFQYAVNAGNYTAQKDFGPYTVNVILETFEAQNYDAFPWALSGTKPWFITPTSAYTGQYSSRSGAITHNQKSIMELTLNFTTAGVMSFARRVSSEQDYDFLWFLIDGVEMDAWSGLVPWAEVSYPLEAGIHKLSWIYEKDQLGTANSDRAWIDDISLPPYEVLVATHAPNQADFGATLSPNPSTGKTWLQGSLPDAQALNIALFDCLGQKVQQYEIPKQAQRADFGLELDLQSLVSGLYFVQLQGKSGVQVLKVVKE
jgi:hypothetical protein